MTFVFQGRAKTVFNKKAAPGHYILRLRAPQLARATKPGQFVQMQVARGIELFLRRPFSLLSADGNTIDILYAVVGKGTEILVKKKAGDWVDVLGPLGNCWSPIREGQRGILVGGGVGIPPLYFLTKESVEKKKSNWERIEVFLGARHKSLLLCQKDFRKLGVKVHVATDDGSAGFRGFVTGLVRDWLEKRGTWDVGRVDDSRLTLRLRSGQATHDSRLYFYACGPIPMLKAIAQIAQEYHLEGEVSLEAHMACGFGICVGCAIPVVSGGYKLCCYHGTVFKMSEVDWGKL